MRLIALALLFFQSFWSFGNNPIGLPDIINYQKTTYGGGTQNWSIQQDQNGVLYFANNEGLLTFDGTYWKIYPLPNKTIVRSLVIAADNKIYVGGQNEFGFFSPSTNGKLEFHSLKDKIPASYRSFADIWDIEAHEKEVFFRSEKRIFKLTDQSIETFHAPSDWIFLGKAGQTVIAQDKKQGLFRYLKGKWVPYEQIVLPPDLMVTSVSGYSKDSILVTSWEHGLYTLQNNSLTPLNQYGVATYADKQIANAFKIQSDMLVVATNIDGCYIVNKSGSVLYNFSKKSGLQNSSVLSILRDHNQNIWLGLNNGIDFIANNDALKHINPDVFADGVGHTSLVHQNHLYLGLSGAVYRLPLAESTDISLLPDTFEYVQQTAGQAWGMNSVGGRLLLGKHEGLFEIKGNSAHPIVTGKGYWSFLPYTPLGQSEPVLLAGNYDGIALFKNRGGVFSQVGTVKGFHESARFITIGQDNMVWASHPYKGVYKINLKDLSNPIITLYTHAEGLPSTFNNHVYKVKDRIVVSTEKGIFEYHAGTDRFVPSAFFRPIFGDFYIRYLNEDGEGNIWFIQDKNLGVCDFSKKQPKLIYFPELNGKLVGGFEHINPINQENIIVGVQNGFYHINYQKYLTNVKKLHVRVSMVWAKAQSDSLLFGGYFGEANEVTNQKHIPNLTYAWNSLHFGYSATLSKTQSNVEYSYYLEGFDPVWSSFQKKTEKEYTKLPHGTYTFHVKARNNFGNGSNVASFRFVILPPWYQTLVAYAVYVLLAFCLVYLVNLRLKKKFKKQQAKFLEKQRRIKYLHQLELEKSEKEIIKLRNDKLESEIGAKNSELAAATMHLVQKAELLSKIKNELTRLNKNSSGEEAVTELKKMIRLLTTEEKADDNWEQFSIYFDKVHSNFLKDLKSEYPVMTANDLRLCAYLKMNLSTKEIAQLMKISPRGVEISRYRLRKKLQIPSEVNLFNFIKDFQKKVA